MKKFALALALALMAGAVSAGPDVSLRPVQRPGASAVAAVAGPTLSVHQSKSGERLLSGSGRVLTSAPRPLTRPQNLETGEGSNVLKSGPGVICGDPDILGEKIGRIRSGVNGCGIADAVRVRSVAGVSLSPSSVMECRTAQTLRHWVTVSAIPRIAAEGSELADLRIVGHYACRPRNNRPGARISEHGKGRAIDIAEFRLRDGTVISVKRDWNTGKGFRPLREMHRDACGIFGTVLGPKSDRFHQDHFHLDTARHGNGAYCR